MRIKVKLENYEDSKRYRYHARTLRIRLGTSNSFSTPIRGVTNSEMSAKARIPTEIPIDAEVGEIIIKLTTGQRRNIESFLRENSTYKSVRKSLMHQKIIMRYFPLTFVLIQPTKSALSKLQSKKYKDKFLRMAFALQIEELNMELVTIPWIGLHPEELLEVYKDYQKSYPDRTFVPFVNIEDNKYVEEFVEMFKPYTDQLKFIGVLYKPIGDARPSYDTLWDAFYDKDVAIILADVKREGDIPLIPNLSVPHYTEFVVGDIIARQVPHGGRFGKLKKRKEIEERVKFFNRENLTVNPLRKVKEDPNWIEKISNSLNSEGFVVDALVHHNEVHGNQTKFNILFDILNAISKVHEFKESREEFLKSQKYIKQTAALDYIKEKETLKKVFLWLQ